MTGFNVVAQNRVAMAFYEWKVVHNQPVLNLHFVASYRVVNSEAIEFCPKVGDDGGFVASNGWCFPMVHFKTDMAGTGTFYGC